MATADSVKQKIQGLIDSANAATGAADTTMSAAVASLIAGFGTGGVSSDLFTAINNDTLTDFTINKDTPSVRAYMFYGSKTLKTADLSELSDRVNDYAFNYCKSLETVIFPAGRSGNWLGGRAFAECSALKEVYINSDLETANTANYTFYNCTNLERFIAPRAIFNNPTRTFSGCSSLSIVDILGGSVAVGTFEKCAMLNTLVLRNTGTVVTLTNINAFNNTPFASGGTGGTVYVPYALIETYKAATNWVTLYEAGTCNFVAIEGSEYE